MIDAARTLRPDLIVADIGMPHLNGIDALLMLRKTDPVASLSPRQREILNLLADERSAKEIAVRLAISPRTVEFHKYKMMELLGAENAMELVRFAIKNGLIDR